MASDVTLHHNDAKLSIFFDNLEKIEAHNKIQNETYQQGLNEDSDKTYEQRKAMKCGTRPPKRRRRSPLKLPNLSIKNLSLPPLGKFG